MSGASALRSRLRAGETLVGTFLKLPGPDAAGVLAGAGFDFAIVDREHSQLSDGEARAAVRALGALGMPTLVRVPAVDRGDINRLLEAGAAGIQLSTVRAAREVARLVAATRFAPVGDRSVSLAHAQAGYGALGLAGYVSASDGEGAPMVVAQLETAASDDPLAAIMAAGADVAFVGTTDLLVDAEMDAGAAARRTAEIAAAAAEAGVPWGGFAADADAVAGLAADGARYVVVASDLTLLRSACAAAASASREAVGV